MSTTNDFLIEDGILKKYTGSDAKVVVPDGVRVIGSYAFAYNRTIVEVAMPEGVIEIGERAFDSCDSLVEINIPDTLNSICQYSFAHCRSLMSLLLSKSVEYVDYHAFDGCISLVNIEVLVDNEHLKSIDGNLYSKDGSKLILYAKGKADASFCVPDLVKSICQGAFINCKKIKELIIPDSVTGIYNNAFHNCSSLFEIRLSKSLTYLGTYAFSNCKSLKEMHLPDTLTYIPIGAFEWCTSLEKIEIPNQVVNIDNYAFRYCESLRTLVIPESVVKIGRYAFTDCQTLEEIEVKGVLSDDMCKELSDLSGLQVVIAPKTPWNTIKKHKLSMQATIGYLLNREKYYKEDDVKEYQKYAATQKKKILSVIFKEDFVEALDSYGVLHLIKINNFEEDFLNPAQDAQAVKCISYLMNLKNDHISEEELDIQLSKKLSADPFNVTDMKKMWDYEKLSDGTLSITGYKGMDIHVIVPERIGKARVSTIGKGAFSPMKKKATAILEKITHIEIPNGVVRIESLAFDHCAALVNVTMPETVKSIGFAAFQCCSSLEVVDIPKLVTSISEYCFVHCSSLKHISIPDTLISISADAFRGCVSLPEVKIPDSIKMIGKRAFEDCKAIVKMVLPISLGSIEAELFHGCVSLREVVVSNGVTTICEYAFRNCTSLLNIVIPDSVTSIHQDAFKGCKFQGENRFSIETYPDSYAKTFAKKKNIKIKELRARK